MRSRGRPFLLVVAFLQTAWAASSDPLLVKTHSGWARGTMEESATGKPVRAFLGIPYAEPPLGALRFRRPSPVTPWSGVLNATSLPDSCVQKLLRVSYHIPILRKQVSITPLSEDCLKLNIWVPDTGPVKAPVIVFIHGGGYSFGGSATPINLGDSLAVEGDLIVVTLNYRLASFGFLFLDETETPGNYGLYDQRLAMEWIHNNIALFGGDPSKITVFGQSAGSSSVLLHLLSGHSDHLIHRVILSSPPRISFVVVNRRDTLRKAMQLSENVGCPSNESDREAIVRCLRDVDPHDIINSEPSESYNNVIFFPVVDGDVVPADWKQRLLAGKFKDVDAILGSNKNEGSMFLMLFSPHVYQPTRDKAQPSFEDYKDVLRNTHFKSELAYKLVEFHYTSWTDLDNSVKMMRASEKTINDNLIACPTNRFGRILCGKQTSKVFRYHFVHPAAGSGAPTWFGAFHGTDLFYVFGDVFRAQPRLPRKELDFALRTMRYWANFARSGDPNEGADGSKEEVVRWPRYKSPDETFLVLAPNSTSTGSGRSFRAKDCAFWEDFLPQIALKLALNDDQMYRYTDP